MLLDIATEKYFKQEVEAGRMPMPESSDKDKPLQDILDGGFEFGNYSIQYLLTGKKGQAFIFYDKPLSDEQKQEKETIIKGKRKIYEYQKNNKDCLNNVYGKEKRIKFVQSLISRLKTCTIICDWKNDEDWSNKEAYSKEYKKNRFNNEYAHEYSVEDIITDSEGNIVDIQLSNPWDTQVVIHKTLQEFIDQVDSISITDENENYDDLKSFANQVGWNLMRNNNIKVLQTCG